MSLSPVRLASILAVLTLLAAPTHLLADEQTDAEPTYAATTAGDPAIDPEVLDIIAAPLTVDELKAEADAWQALVKQAAEQVAEAKLEVRRSGERRKVAKTRGQSDGQTEAGASATSEQEITRADRDKDAALDALTERRAERDALIARMNVILDRIDQKIGLDENGRGKPEVMGYRRYIDAVGGIKIDVSDAESTYAGIVGWVTASDGGLRWAKNIAVLLAILLGFVILAALFAHATRKALKVAGNRSELLQDFLIQSVRRVTLAVGAIVALSAIGINIGPLLAVIGAAGFVVAFALQSTLSNFASGIMILLYRPFDVGDAVEVAGIAGTVRSLNLVSATITTFDNKLMVVPNNEIWGNIITNATGSTERRVDMIFGIGYGDDVGKAKQILEQIVAEHELVLADPAPVIQLNELGESSVNLICRPWTKTGDYWTVYWDVTREVKERFDAKGISIPFPQRDVHIHQQATLPQPDSGADRQNTRQGADQMGLEAIDPGS